MGSDLKSCLMWETERPSECNRPICSSYFHLFGEEWKLKLTIIPRNNQYYCIVHLCPRNSKTVTEMGASANCHVATGTRAFVSSEQFSIRDSEQKILEEKFSTNDYDNSSPKWIICCCINSDKPLSLLINNETNLISIGTSNPTDLQQLSDDFSRLLDKEIIPDASLTCGNRTWKVHRSILTARSEVFAGMFRSGMAESETGAVRIEDLEVTVLDLLLKYLYCGMVRDLSEENVSGLYEAADRYALLGLRKVCSDYMVEILSLENCLGFLLVADAHGDAQLKELVVSSVTKHFAQIEKAVWTNFRKEHLLLAVEVLERFAPSMEK